MIYRVFHERGFSVQKISRDWIHSAMGVIGRDGSDQEGAGHRSFVASLRRVD